MSKHAFRNTSLLLIDFASAYTFFAACHLTKFSVILSRNRYRKNVAIVVVNKDGKILACQRSDIENAWQIPQGGIDEGETAEEALFRELEEELGTSAVEIIGRLPGSISYDWPEKLHWRGYQGQEQIYYLVRVNKDSDIRLFSQPTEEFSSCEWVSVTEFFSRLSGFKKAAYTQGISQLQEMFGDFFRS